MPTGTSGPPYSIYYGKSTKMPSRFLHRWALKYALPAIIGQGSGKLIRYRPGI
jgi:hypothetical protein